jgi:hypothetical protein
VTTEVLLSEHVYASAGDKREGSRRKMSFKPIVVVAFRREVALSHLRSKTEVESIGKAQEYLASIVYLHACSGANQRAVSRCWRYREL